MSEWVTSRDLSTATAGFQVEQGVAGYASAIQTLYSDPASTLGQR